MKIKRRVLYMQPAPRFGGAERQAATNIPLLCDQGIDVLTMTGPGLTILDWLRERGVYNYFHSRWFPGGWPKQRGLAKITLPFRYYNCVRHLQAEVETLIRNERIDLVFSAMPISWIAATPVARRLGVPIVWRAGGTETTRTRQIALARWSRRHKPDLLICNGDAVARMFEPIVGARTEVVRNGLDLDQFHPADAASAHFRPSSARATVGFAARLAEQKRPQDFIALAARLAVSHPDIAFLIAGDGSREPEYRAMAAEMGARNVHFLGYVGDMHSFYASCDILVLPSRSEGCPNVALEAMASRTAIVAAETAGTREVIRPDRDGILYPVGDIDLLTEGVTNMLDNNLLYERMVDSAFRRVNSHFSARACAEHTANLIHQTLAASPKRLLPFPQVATIAR